jgi:hydrogenase/urease accessory protein HupE
MAGVEGKSWPYVLLGIGVVAAITAYPSLWYAIVIFVAGMWLGSRMESKH